MSDKIFSADIIYELVLEATGDIEKAEASRTDWICAREHAHKDGYSPVNIDGIGLAGVFAEIFGQHTGSSAREEI